MVSIYLYTSRCTHNLIYYIIYTHTYIYTEYIQIYTELLQSSFKLKYNTFLLRRRWKPSFQFTYELYLIPIPVETSYPLGVN